MKRNLSDSAQDYHQHKAHALLRCRLGPNGGRLDLSFSFLPPTSHHLKPHQLSAAMKVFSLVSLLVACLAASTTDAELTKSSSGACTLSGSYTAVVDVSTCDSLTISALTVSPQVTLDLTNVKAKAAITFTGTTTFGTATWDGPLVKLTGTGLTVSGSGILDGQGAWYWKQGTGISRPVFFRLSKVVSSHLSGFTIKNSPFRTFSILSSTGTTLSGLTLDSSAGDSSSPAAKNTDGFDLSSNIGVTITNNKIYNQDDCLAMQSSQDTTFSNNLCSGGHGISIGSLGGSVVDSTTTVSGLIVSGNTIKNSVNGIRIKTITGDVGKVYNATYTNNILSTVTNAIVIHSDYSKDEGGYTGTPSSKVTISDIKINGLSGTCESLYSIVANSAVVSSWTFSSITATASKTSTCSGVPDVAANKCP